MTTAAPVQPLPLVGVGVVSSAGYGLTPLAAAPDPHSAPTGAGEPDAAYPPRPVRPVAGFAVADHLGRKGTKNLDRLAGLSLVACKQALEAAGAVVGASAPDRTGVVLATNTGSIAGYSDLLYDTLTLEKPYLINPGKFAGSVMNCSAGQMAIRHGLKGLNATVAGGRSASLYAFRHARLAMAAGRAESLLVGGAEELSAPAAWAWHHAGTLRAGAPVGEGSAVFVVEAEESPDRPPLAELLACEVGYHGWAGTRRRPPGRRGLTDALATTVTRALERSGVRPEEPVTVSLSATGHIGLDRLEERAVRLALGGRTPEQVRVSEVLGETYSASGALQLAALLAHWRRTPAGAPRTGLVTSVGHDGNAGALVVRERG
ncbi:MULTISPECIES: beta-ketoacyl synthase N-terminal-like domain-containing protein [unclassified Streptomyces]|uniref:beta-ketoacyl synthase N-terminal-like domain-containing protein n=1 Tax=unclassified Streptomyces TaxID=2593676 RepID=UPI00331F4375